MLSAEFVFLFQQEPTLEDYIEMPFVLQYNCEYWDICSVQTAANRQHNEQTGLWKNYINFCVKIYEHELHVNTHTELKFRLVSRILECPFDLETDWRYVLLY